MSYRIVVGVDGSRHSDAAVRWALEEAGARNGEVTAVFAWQLPFLSLPGAFDRDELEKAGKEFIIDNVSRIVPTPPVPLPTLVAEGDPAESLIAASTGATCWWSAPGAGRRVAGLLLGSVSQRCAAGASCPVVLVKLPGEDVSEGMAALGAEDV